MWLSDSVVGNLTIAARINQIDWCKTLKFNIVIVQISVNEILVDVVNQHQLKVEMQTNLGAPFCKYVIRRLRRAIVNA